jgi:creatinine amidohydrolase
VDHAAMNETSLTMALRPDLVEMDQLPHDLSQWPVGVGGRDPRVYASPELGEQIIAANLERMAGILRAALARLAL